MASSAPWAKARALRAARCADGCYMIPFHILSWQPAECISTPMLTVRYAGFTILVRRLALHPGRMSTRSPQVQITSSEEPAAKRQRIQTSAAPPAHDAKMAAAQGESMIPHDAFAKLREEMTYSDTKREEIIKKSRDVQKFSKQAIFAAHRGDIKHVTKLLADAEAVSAEILPILTELPTLRYGSFSNAMEETFLKDGRVILPTELKNVERDEYLGGVLDFTGELNRYAVAKATRRDIAAVTKCRDVVEGLMGEFLQFDLRNGVIRKKYDALKYTLRKMENTLYELSLAEAGFKPQADADGEGRGEQAQGEIAETDY